MALSECSVSFLTAFFTILKLSWEHIGWVITGALVLGIAASVSKWFFSILLEIVSALDDFVGNLTLFSGGVFAFFGSLFLGIALSVLLGLGWAALVLMSNANVFLKASAAPFYFFIGLAWGFFPWSIPGGTVGLQWAFTQKNIANILCIIPLVLFFLSFFVFGNWLCAFVNYMSVFLV